MASVQRLSFAAYFGQTVEEWLLMIHSGNGVKDEAQKRMF